MLTDLLILAPVGLALGLIMFGHYGDRRPEATAPRIAATAIAALLLGPVAVEVFGLFVWLLGVAAVVAAVAMVAALRAPQPRRHA